MIHSMQNTFTPTRVGKIIGARPSTIVNFVQDGIFPTVFVNGRLRIPKASVARFIHDNCLRVRMEVANG